MNDDQRKQYLIEFGNRVKELRLEKEMSQDELAKRCGYGSRSTINKIELGITQSKIKAIAEALNVSIGTLLCWDEMDSSHDTKKLQAEVEQIELDSTIEKKYGKSAFEALTMFVQLDTLDQGRIIGSMETLLEDEKYSVKKESSNGKAM